VTDLTLDFGVVVVVVVSWADEPGDRLRELPAITIAAIQRKCFAGEGIL